MERMAEYEFLWFRGVFMDVLLPGQIENLRSVIVEEGSGSFVEAGGLTKNWVEGVNRPWVDSTLAEVFPNDPGASDIWEEYQFSMGPLPYSVVVNQDPRLPPVVSMLIPLGIEEFRSWYLVLAKPQQGATTWAWAKGAYPGVLGGDPPWLLSWRYGEGMTWSMASAWWDPNYGSSGFPGNGVWTEQTHGLDLFVNMVLHSLGRPLPGDIVLVNTIRQRFQLLTERFSTLYYLMDFVERFGVSSSRLMAEQHLVGELVGNAEDLYLDGFYQLSLNEVDRVEDVLYELENKVIRWRNQALRWIHTIEWAAVSGTAILAGYLTYMVMLRRKFYRQVEITKFGGNG
jgi:hypothetical protein